MSARLAGRLLLAVGGVLLVLGAMFPEVQARVAALRHGGKSIPPERSHWGVITESLDMLEDPDPSLDDWYYRYYATEVAGLSWLVVVGGVVALSSLVLRSRFAALLFALLHVVSFAGLSALAWTVRLSAPADADASGGLGRGLLVGGVVLALLVVGEAVLAWRALSRGRTRRIPPVDAVQVLPVAFLLLLHGALFVLLRNHPNWPTAGYLVGAAGAAVAFVGILLRRDPAITAAVA